jgi:RNA polymerase sigma-70 factor, ECF subfamily
MDLYKFDEDYLHRLKEHDPATEGHFLAYFSQRLNSILRRVERTDLNIDDVRQETFARVWFQISQGNLQHPQSFGSYVSAVCRQVLQEKYHDFAGKIEASETEGETPGLEDEMVRFEYGALVHRILDELSERDREILRARFFDDKDNEKICGDFGVDRDYLRVLFHRAVRRFGELYSKTMS